MILRCDKTGFPLVSLRSGIDMQLLPVTKAQFDAFLVESPDFPPEAYAQMMALNPPLELGQLTAENREQIFLTGILPEEALQFAQWLGEGYDFPTVEEWRGMYDDLLLEVGSFDYLQQLPEQCESAMARDILRRLINQIQPYSLMDISLLRQGVVEWVHTSKHPGDFAGLGTPRPQFQPNLYDPLTDVVRPLSRENRIKYFGFRLIHR